MNNITFLTAYLLTLLGCIVLTIGLINLLSKGLKKYFENITQDQEIAGFFTKLTKVILLLGGIGAALGSAYSTDKANWLTLTFDIGDHLYSSMNNLFIALIILAIVFFILHLIAKKVNQ